MEWTSISPIVYPVAVFCITSLLGYIAYTVNRMRLLLEKHERVLFGDKEIQLFEGIVPICIANSKYCIADRKVIIALITKLCEHGVIDIDSEMREALEELKKYE